MLFRLILKLILSILTMYSIKWHNNIRPTTNTLFEIISMSIIVIFVVWMVYEIINEENHNKARLLKEKSLAIKLEQLLIKKETFDIKREKIKLGIK